MHTPRRAYSSRASQITVSKVVEAPGQAQIKLARGLSLVGVTPEGKTELIRRVDACVDVPEDERYSFAQDMEKRGSDFSAFVIAEDDSAFCGDHNKYLEELFADTGFEKWREIGFREPYVALRAANGEQKEFNGMAEGVLFVETIGLQITQD